MVEKEVDNGEVNEYLCAVTTDEYSNEPFVLEHSLFEVGLYLVQLPFDSNQAPDKHLRAVRCDEAHR